MTRVEPSATVAQLLERHPVTIRVFIGHRMACIGCAIGPYHTVEEACAEYDLPISTFMRELMVAGNRS